MSHVDTTRIQDVRSRREGKERRTLEERERELLDVARSGKGKGEGDPRTGSYILKGRRDSTAWPVSRLDPPKLGAGARGRPL